jgi:alpha-1,2-mannosyltransferase
MRPGRVVGAAHMNGMFPARKDTLASLAGVAALALVAAVAGWVVTASLQQDLAAYWVAGAARNAGLDPYVNHVGGAAAPELWDGVDLFAHSRFLYPPLAAELFRPLARLPYAAAKAVFTLAALGAWIFAALRAARAAGARGGAVTGLVAGALFYPLYLHLERGQIDLMLLALLAVAFDARAGVWLAGGALAAAAAFKPSLLALVPVLAALGRRRVAGAALVGAAAVVLATALVSGPALLREYATEVLPRAALYGEGGDESMLLPEARLAAHAADLEAGVARLDGRVYQQAAWDGPASASLPRLLSPSAPSPLATRLVPLGLFAALVAVAFAVRRRGASEAAQAFVSWAGALACVIASPAGWIMGLVWALPLVPWLVRLRAAPGRPRAWAAVVLVGAACAVRPPFAGWAALAGTALVAAAALLALRVSAPAQEAR